jgi:hypothetical protein
MSRRSPSVRVTSYLDRSGRASGDLPDAPALGYSSSVEAIVMTKLRGVGVGVVFLMGCAVGGAAGRFVAPPANAEQVARLTHWEYFCFDEYAAGPVTEKANRAGLQGWEMVAAGSRTASDDILTWCFKRPKL